METNEPTLAPQWLKNNRHVTGFVTAASPLHPGYFHALVFFIFFSETCIFISVE